ncbi:MAG: DUF488 family protein [Thermodesulfovibrionales bacterium]|nr:DUF488 family protein [Thermodesulfovibrionales bacterium]
MKRIYTLGTGRRSEEDFIEILFDYDIKTLIDVRSFPMSKMPVFTRDNLENLLKKEGISYVFLGKELGGFRKGGYEAYTETEDFKKGIDKLEQIALETKEVIARSPESLRGDEAISKDETPCGVYPQRQTRLPRCARNDTLRARNTVIICAERFPWKCHRRWIARDLHRRGWQIEHIIDKGKVWTPRS